MNKLKLFKNILNYSYKRKLVFTSVFLAGIMQTQAQITFFGDPEPVRELNTPSGENFIFLDFDNQKIFFSREKYPQNTAKTKDPSDIWTSQLDSGWSVPAKMPVNDADFSSPIGITPDGAFFLYNRTWYDKGLYYGAVYAYPLQKKKEAFQVDIPYFKNRSPLQTGSLSGDGRYLLLSLENNLGYGVDDLFICILQEDGTWSAPKNLGEQVNTKLQELSPVLAADNKTLIFASNGHGGMGSFDLFKATRMDDTWQHWTVPESIGSINTNGSETSFAFSDDSEFAYFVSTQNSDGYGDIKRIRIRADFDEDEASQTPVVMTLRGEEEVAEPFVFQMKDKKTQAAVVGKAVIALADGASSIVDADANGTVSVPLQGALSAEFKAEGYLSVKQTLSGLEPAGQATIAMESLETGNVITLSNVLFYKGTANFVEGSESELDMVADMLKENPDVDIFLKGHTDNVGNDVLNVQLSRERVLAVKEYLIAAGIASARIDGEGYGGSQPVASNDQEATRKLNRRVEFEIIRN